MGYMDNSYSNSNNGGSVNSQDSIWQMKSAAANGVGQPYDLAGYATTESDYPTHPHYLPQREDYRESHNLSRQQFCSEPFATVVKSQKHVGEWYSSVHPLSFYPSPSSTTLHDRPTTTTTIVGDEHSILSVVSSRAIKVSTISSSISQSFRILEILHRFFFPFVLSLPNSVLYGVFIHPRAKYGQGFKIKGGRKETRGVVCRIPTRGGKRSQFFRPRRCTS